MTRYSWLDVLLWLAALLLLIPLATRLAGSIWRALETCP